MQEHNLTACELISLFLHTPHNIKPTHLKKLICQIPKIN